MLALLVSRKPDVASDPIDRDPGIISLAFSLFRSVRGHFDRRAQAAGHGTATAGQPMASSTAFPYRLP